MSNFDNWFGMHLWPMIFWPSWLPTRLMVIDMKIFFYQETILTHLLCHNQNLILIAWLVCLIQVNVCDDWDCHFLPVFQKGPKRPFLRKRWFFSFLKSFIFTKPFEIIRCPFNMLLIIGHYKSSREEICFHWAIEEKYCFKVRAKMQKSSMPSASKSTFMTIL